MQNFYTDLIPCSRQPEPDPRGAQEMGTTPAGGSHGHNNAVKGKPDDKNLCAYVSSVVTAPYLEFLQPNSRSRPQDKKQVLRLFSQI